MINYDVQAKQVLTPLCRKCPDQHFAPADDTLAHVGCCSYSPTFTLFEIYKMLKGNQLQFFLEHIYNHPTRTLKEYGITIHAQIAPIFFTLDNSSLSNIEYEDKKLRYSVCQFFAEEKGCTLPALFKTSICRSFICSTIEEKLERNMQQQFISWSKDIQEEAESFNCRHEQMLKEKGWNLREHISLVVEYLANLN